MPERPKKRENKKLKQAQKKQKKQQRKMKKQKKKSVILDDSSEDTMQRLERMISVEPVNNLKDLKKFVLFPFQLYKNSPYWVPSND